MRAILWRSLQAAAGATSTRAPRTSAGYAVPKGTRAKRARLGSGLLGILFFWQGPGQGADGAFEVRQVLLDGCLQDSVTGGEVAVAQVVPHPRDLPPRKGRLSGKQACGQRLDCLADLQQPDPDGVEDQAVGQVAALAGESGSRRSRPGCRTAADVPGSSQSHPFALDARADAGLEVAGRDQVHPGAEDGLQLGLHSPQPDAALAGGQVGKQVNAAVRPVLAAGDAAANGQ